MACGGALVDYVPSVYFRVESEKARRRAEWLHRWCKIGLRILNAKVTVEGPVPSRGLIISNHLSYIDIFVFSAVAPCVFVSKKEVRKWPIFGPIGVLAGTLFIDRERKGDVRRVGQQIPEAIDQGLRVQLFGEGTTSNGDSVLPFRPSLFEPMVSRPGDVTAAAIAYSMPGSCERDELYYWGGVTLAPHAWRMCGYPEIFVRVKYSPIKVDATDRKQLAAKLHEIVRGLRNEIQFS